MHASSRFPQWCNILHITVHFKTRTLAVAWYYQLSNRPCLVFIRSLLLLVVYSTMEFHTCVTTTRKIQNSSITTKGEKKKKTPPGYTPNLTLGSHWFILHRYNFWSFQGYSTITLEIIGISRNHTVYPSVFNRVQSLALCVCCYQAFRHQAILFYWDKSCDILVPPLKSL